MKASFCHRGPQGTGQNRETSERWSSSTRSPRGYVVRVGGRDQSYVDLDDPVHLAFDYVRRMADVVDAIAEPGQPSASSTWVALA